MRHINVQSIEYKGAALRSRARLGFTMVELLVVIAISVLLFGLLLKPLVDSLSLTQQAQATAAAQDSARKTMEVVTRELGSAAYIYDGASHPFVADAAYATNAGTYPIDRFTNFLNLQVPTKNLTTGVQGVTVAHAYNAKLDFVQARRVPGFTDPTTDAEAKLVSGAIQPTDLLLPVAPGTTMVRYFVGLKNPEKPYRNTHEGSGLTTGDDNTYVLYRAQFAPYNKDGTINSALFATNANGKVELDDPDFFRGVTDADINWLDAAHTQYGSSSNAHNIMLSNWEKIAQRVIGAPQVDLLLLPHNSDGSIAYDLANGKIPGVAHYSAMTDPVTGTVWPVVNTSVNFRPTVTNDATPATTGDYASSGVPADATDDEGLPYIPTVYRTTGQSWNDPFSIRLYPANYVDKVDSYFLIERVTTTDTASVSQFTAGDLVEYQISKTGVPTPVCNITKSTPITTSNNNNYVPAIINPDLGTIRFSVTALPNANAPSLTDWTGVPTVDAAGHYVIDLKTLTQSPINTVGAAGSVLNAIIVPGSVRVYGPEVDTNASTLVNPANAGKEAKILYRPVGPGDTPTGDQYYVDYKNGTITFADAKEITWAAATANTPVSIQWSYQSNLTPKTAGTPISTANPALPMTVKVDYQSRDLIAVNIGVRIYPSSNSLAQIVSASSNVKVGDSNR